VNTALSIEHTPSPSSNGVTKKPTFERCADETLARVREIYADRGDNYGDSWTLDNQRTAVTDATLTRFGVTHLAPEEKRLLQLAVLIDVKDSRLAGKFNIDSLDDGIAYRGAYATLRDEYERKAASVNR